MAETKKPKVYVDGQAGTTGLEIIGRLRGRDDLELLMLPDEKRHDAEARKDIMKEADLVFLCLPDEAAEEAVSLCDPSTKIIDASTAHRTKWTYGFPELSAEHKKQIQSSRLVANPGCHASGFIALIYPLVASGWMYAETPLSAFSLTGYTGGGKKMIEEYEQNKETRHEAPALYGLSLSHKHLPEMKQVCGLAHEPLFVPVVDDYPRGMLVSLTLSAKDFAPYREKMTPDLLRSFYQEWYRDALAIRVAEKADEGRLEANRMSGNDFLEIHVNGNEDSILISALFDNLGKGASGAAIENMNLMLGLEEGTGLRLEG